METMMWVVTLKNEWCYGPFKTSNEAKTWVMENATGSLKLRDFDIYMVIGKEIGR